MFVYRRQIRLSDTDVTGVIYFAEQFKIAMETLEAFLTEKGYPLSRIFDSEYFMPVVHAKADYLAPVRIGEELEICLKVAQIGNSSVTFDYTLYDPKRSIEVGRVEMVHVAVDREKRSSVPIPLFLREMLETAQDGVLETRV